jgi:UDP-glucose 4-epimerase
LPSEDKELLDQLLGRGFKAVMHLASFIQVGESVSLSYFNVAVADTEDQLG